MWKRLAFAAFAFIALTGAESLVAQAVTPVVTRSAVSAPVSDVRYEVTFTREQAARGVARVAMTFVAEGADPVLLSLPAWTPGAYEISNFGRRVLDFSATAGGRALNWDKLDPDTWRIRREGATSPVTVTFEFRADTLDNAMAWSRPDFLFFNGTNLFLYPEGRGHAFSSRVTVRTEADWRVTTALPRAGALAGQGFAARDYHELVDAPFFVGRYDIDSAEVSGKWMRFATYPAASIQGVPRLRAWDQLKRVTPPLVAVFGDVPWERYTVMQIVDSAYQGASGLEHADSHVDIFSPLYLGSDFQPSLYAHEIFHAWNVKRLRPADMWPYRYDVPMPTTWLWMAEGITDYYADIALVRGGVVNDSGFYAMLSAKINEVDALPTVALEDASLSTWLQPIDGTQYIYYPKGALAGLMLDILIRDGSDNARSLDDVLRELYAATYRQGRGFTRDDFWGAVNRAAGRSLADFERRYIDGREPFPWDDVLPLAGLRAVVRRVPSIGVATGQDARGIRITEIDADGVGAAAGIRVGDYLLSIADISVMDPSFGPRFLATFENAREGQPVKFTVTRGDRTLTLAGPLRLVPGPVELRADPGATGKAARVRQGIVVGR